MSPNIWSDIFSGATLVVISATAFAALVQLRHLRTSNQLSALLTLMQMWQRPDMQEHVKYMRGELQHKIGEPGYLPEFEKEGLARADHPELLVADFLDQVGAFMKYDLIDAQSWLDVAGSQISGAWDSLEPVITAMRRRAGSTAFDNFEYLAVRARQWEAEHTQGAYPKGVPRMADLDPRELKR